MSLSAAAFLIFCFGCDKSTFTSEDLAAGRLSPKISDRDQVVLRMDDGNLLCVTQSGDIPHFFKTASGYPGRGGSVALGPIGGVGVNSAGPNVFMELNYLETLAYYTNNWRYLRDEVAKQCGDSPRAIDSRAIEKVLSTLVPLLEGRSSEWREPPSSPHQGPHDVRWEFDWQKGEYHIVSVDTNLPPIGRISVYPRIDGGNLLQISQVGDQIHFSKTSAGYAQGALQANVCGFGGELLTTSGITYTTVSKLEAKAYADGGAAVLYEAARKQSLIVSNSVSPSLLRLAVGY